MTPLKIQLKLRKKGISQKAVASDLDVSEMSISCVIAGTRISDRIMKHIAGVIGADHRDVFPGYYRKPAKRSTSKVA